MLIVNVASCLAPSWAVCLPELPWIIASKDLVIYEDLQEKLPQGILITKRQALRAQAYSERSR